MRRETWPVRPSEIELLVPEEYSLTVLCRVSSLRIREGYPFPAPEVSPPCEDLPVPLIERGVELGMLRIRLDEEELG